MSNLLVVDFDYFFRNPLYAVDGADPNFWMYDWAHAENNMHINTMWPLRGAEFLRNGIELPRCKVPEGWWDRFSFTDDVVCEISDSNMYSGVAGGEKAFEHVWLFDAHHDLYRIKTRDDLVDFAEKGSISCEDWMWVHKLNGSKLHWRWPQWFFYGKKMREREIPKWADVDARKDDLGKLGPHMVFDTISICRSGAWVPSWCDDQFEEFVKSVPADVVQVDNEPLYRIWNQEAAQILADQTNKMMAEANAKIGDTDG